MLLAASSADALGVLTVDAAPGTPVRVADIEFDGTPRIEITDFQKVTLEARDGRPFYNGKPLQAAGADVVVDRGVDGGIK